MASLALDADMVLHNGTILVLDANNSTSSAMAIKGNRIVALGGAELITQFDQAEHLDLQGKTVMPGFNDTHVHISGKPARYIDLTEVASIAQIKALVTAKSNALAPGEWITGYGWSEDELSEGRRPTIHDLDDAAPDNPTMLTRAGAHSAVFSSKAFQLAGIDANTPDPEGGAIERGDDGRLNGIIRERHEEMVGKLVPLASNEELQPSLKNELTKLFALGITSITEAMNTIEYYPQWQQLYRENPGQLPRASVQVAYENQQDMANFRAQVEQAQKFLKVGPIKIFADGGFTGPAAYTKRPYKGEDEYRGKLNMSPADLRAQIRQAHRDGWQLGIHAIGDAAIELVVEYLVEALTDMPRDNHRHYLNHFTIMPSDATMKDMAAHGIAITQQPNFAYTLEGRYSQYLDGKRLQHNNPMATPMSHGIHVAMSSDILPLGPWVGIYTATTRKGMSGRIFGEQERISRFDALRAYTNKGAYLTREEHEKGTLTPGMLADFIVLSDDPYKVSDEALLKIKVERVFLDGREVYALNK